MSKQLKGILSILLATVIWGTTFVAQSVGVEIIGPFTLLAMRCILAVIFLLAVLFLRSKKDALRILTNKKLWKAGVPCGIALFVATAFQQVGLMHTTVGKAGFITTMYIVLVPLFGLFFKRKPTWNVIVSIFIAVAGLFLISGAGISAVNIGDVLMLLCAAAFAIQILILDRVAAALDSIALNMVQALVCGAIAFVCMFCLEAPRAANILSCWFPLFYAGVVSMGVAYTLQIVGQKHIEPTAASLLMSFESVFAALSGGIFLKETMTIWEILGCVLVFSAVILSQLPIPNIKRQRT